MLFCRVKNTWEVSNYLLNNFNRLLYFKEEEVDEFKNNISKEMEECSNEIKNLFSFCNSLNEIYRKEITCFKTEGKCSYSCVYKYLLLLLHII